MAETVDPRALPELPPAIGPNGAPDGLFQKFDVRRRDGKDLPGGPKQGAWYFVLDCFNDPYARAATSAYATACQEELPELAEDLRSVLASWEPVPGGPEEKP